MTLTKKQLSDLANRAQVECQEVTDNDVACQSVRPWDGPPLPVRYLNKCVEQNNGR